MPYVRTVKTASGAAAGQGELDLGLELSAQGGGSLPITSSRMGCLLDALARAYDVLGLGAAAGGDGVFRDLVLARVIEPASHDENRQPSGTPPSQLLAQPGKIAAAAPGTTGNRQRPRPEEDPRPRPRYVTGRRPTRGSAP